MITGLDTLHAGAFGARESGSPPHGPQTGSFAAQLARAFDRIDRVGSERLEAVASTDGPEDLLRVQAEVYRDAQKLEIASKIVDYAVGSVKTLLQTRV